MDGSPARQRPFANFLQAVVRFAEPREHKAGRPQSHPPRCYALDSSPIPAIQDPQGSGTKQIFEEGKAVALRWNREIRAAAD